jgi:hypothetical protein
MESQKAGNAEFRENEVGDLDCLARVVIWTAGLAAWTARTALRYGLPSYSFLFTRQMESQKVIKS